MNGGQAIVKTLIKHKVSHTFGYPGGGIVPVFDALLDHSKKIKNILVRHEEGAVHMADGFARATGTPGVCIATSGPGASNLVTGMLTAWMDSSPIIAMAGQVPFKLIGHEAFQEADMVDIALHTCKKDFQIRHANEVFDVFNQAFRLSTEGRPGPVYIDLPKNAQEGKLTKKIPKKVPVSKPKFTGQLDKLKRTANLMLNAQTPVFLIGGGVLWANAANEFMKLVDLVKIPVITTLMAKSVFPDRHPLAFGMHGLYGTKTAAYALNNSDLVIAIGCRFSNRTIINPADFPKNRKIVHINVDKREINENVKTDIGIVGDARLVIMKLTEMIRKMAKSKERPWHKNLRTFMTKEREEFLDKDTKPISHKKVMFELRKIIKDKDILVTGVGNHQMLAEHYIDRKYPRTFITSGGEGTMGFGLPASIGAKVAMPNREVINFDGDGSFQMTMEELAVLAQENIKVTTILLKNHYLSMVRQWQEKIYGKKRRSAVFLANKPSFSKIAEAYGLNGISVTRPSELGPALRKAKKSKTSTIVSVHTIPGENYFPLTPPAITEKDFRGKIVR
ncbi:biosynthetic-type acetolactate synthase large subunit [Nanoarchaeota archaeon]